MRVIVIALLAIFLTTAGPDAGSGLALPHYVDPGTVRKRALRDVERRLRQAPVPPGARRISKAPKGSHLSAPGMTIDSKDFLDKSQIWSLANSPIQVLEWIEAHPPAGLPVKLKSKFGVGGETAVTEVGYEWRELPSEVVERYLYLAVGSAPDGRTVLRVDSQGVWVFPHPATEVIPATAQLLEVLRDPEGGPPSKERINDPRKVRRLAIMIDRLPATQPVEFEECGPGLPEDAIAVTLLFRDYTGSVVAEARQQVPEGWCTPMELTIDGKPEHPLEGGARLLQKQLRLL